MALIVVTGLVVGAVLVVALMVVTGLVVGAVLGVVL